MPKKLSFVVNIPEKKLSLEKRSLDLHASLRNASLEQVENRPHEQALGLKYSDQRVIKEEAENIYEFLGERELQVSYTKQYPIVAITGNLRARIITP